MEIGQLVLRREETALVIIDIQEKLVAAMKKDVAERMIANAVILIETAKEFAVPIVVSEQYRKGLGPTVPDVAGSLGPIETHEKLHFDCMRDDTLGGLITSIGRRNFIIVGIEAHVCVFQTALSLLAKGMHVTVASDATASRRKHDWHYALRALAGAGAVVYPTETIAFMLMERAGTPEFKRLAPLFK
ncbi:MAG: isochorismatase family protein [Spirochaetes bacterium]|nr:isochorismatase family protein [Spirochaetota bacterium]